MIVESTLNSPTADACADASFAAAVERAKLEALYQFAYGLSHEINNPLANIALRAQTLLKDETDPKRQKMLETINQQAFRAHEMIADLMLFARPPALNPQPVDLAELARTVVAEMQPAAQEQGTTLCCWAEPDLSPISADPTHLAVALKALIQNSLEALITGGTVQVSVDPAADFRIQNSEFRIDPAHDSATAAAPTRFTHVISVADNGPGISPGVRPHIFDPFFSGREAGRGLGLGLSKAWRIVELHGGKIEVSSMPSGGATLRMLLTA